VERHRSDPAAADRARRYQIDHTNRIRPERDDDHANIGQRPKTYGWKVRTVAEDGTGASVFSLPCYFTAGTGTLATLTGAQVMLGDNTVYTAAHNTTWTGPTSHLTFQDDGNLVLYRNSDHAVLWYSGTYGHPDAALTLQKDGNLVIYDGVPSIANNDQVTGNFLWSTATSGNANSKIVVQTDGNVVISTVSGSQIWSTNIAKP